MSGFCVKVSEDHLVKSYFCKGISSSSSAALISGMPLPCWRFQSTRNFVKVMFFCSMLWASALQSAQAFCFADAAQKYKLNEMLLRAIATHESRMNPSLVLENTNGSYDLGLMGINTAHLKTGEKLARAGFTPQNLLEPCNNVMAGAYLLALKIQTFGLTWTAIGAYHSTTDEFNRQYQQKIWASYQRIVRAAGTQP